MNAIFLDYDVKYHKVDLFFWLNKFKITHVLSVLMVCFRSSLRERAKFSSR
jgi:hypothetical protein